MNKEQIGIIREWLGRYYCRGIQDGVVGYQTYEGDAEYIAQEIQRAATKVKVKKPKIVRCKDCKFYNGGCCELVRGMTSPWGSDYCSLAEKKK